MFDDVTLFAFVLSLLIVMLSLEALWLAWQVHRLDARVRRMEAEKTHQSSEHFAGAVVR